MSCNNSPDANQNIHFVHTGWEIGTEKDGLRKFIFRFQRYEIPNTPRQCPKSKIPSFTFCIPNTFGEARVLANISCTVLMTGFLWEPFLWIFLYRCMLHKFSFDTLKLKGSGILNVVVPLDFEENGCQDVDCSNSSLNLANLQINFDGAHISLPYFFTMKTNNIFQIWRFKILQ